MVGRTRPSGGGPAVRYREERSGAIVEVIQLPREHSQSYVRCRYRIIYPQLDAIQRNTIQNLQRLQYADSLFSTGYDY